MKLKYSKVYELQPDPYDCTQKKHLRICLFKDVKNSGTLCELVRSGEIDAAIIKAELVAEPFILLAAANRAIHQAAHNRIYTRSLAAELVYSLSPTRNISESLITFGVGGENKNLIVATFGDQNGKQMSKIGKHIEGTPVSMDTLKEVVDLATIKRVYRVPERELSSSQLSDYIVTRIICKDIAS